MSICLPHEAAGCVRSQDHARIHLVMHLAKPTVVQNNQCPVRNYKENSKFSILFRCQFTGDNNISEGRRKLHEIEG